ncbi:hypothetical protein L1279_001678 [Planomicrobium sp. HSC-17F08]|nr:hypothetical protein [Planomicrobium sp. HSC-17F08]
MGITPRFLIELVKEEFVKASGKWRTFVTCFDTFTNVLFMGLGKDLERSERCTFTNASSCSKFYFPIKITVGQRKLFFHRKMAEAFLCHLPF